MQLKGKIDLAKRSINIKPVNSVKGMQEPLVYKDASDGSDESEFEEEITEI